MHKQPVIRPYIKMLLLLKGTEELLIYVVTWFAVKFFLCVCVWNERWQTPKDTYCMILYNKAKLEGSKQVSGCQGLGGQGLSAGDSLGERWGWQKYSVWKDISGHIILFIYLNPVKLHNTKFELYVFFFKFIYLFLAASRLHWGARVSHCGGFSCCGARALGARASVVVACGLSSCGSQAPECRLSSCGEWA